MDFVSYGHFESDDITLDGFAIAPFNLKYGFTNSVDVQLVFAPYLHDKSTSGGVETVEDGTGPLGLRFKINLAGNDDGGTAVAVLPYLIAPTRGIDKLDYTLIGVVVPVTFPLEGDRAFGVMAGAEQLGDIETFGIASATFSSPIAESWSGFVELYSIFDGFADEDDQIVTLDGGLVFAPRDD